jgi:hypothetical protein
VLDELGISVLLCVDDAPSCATLKR